MHIPDMIPTLEASDLYRDNDEFRDLVDRMSGKKGKQTLKGNTVKLKTFTDWNILDPNGLPAKFQIRKDGTIDVDPNEELFSELFTA